MLDDGKEIISVVANHCFIALPILDIYHAKRCKYSRMIINEGEITFVQLLLLRRWQQMKGATMKY